MKLKKLASLVIAGAMLVSALPMTANATALGNYNWEVYVNKVRAFTPNGDTWSNQAWYTTATDGTGTYSMTEGEGKTKVAEVRFNAESAPKYTNDEGGSYDTLFFVESFSATSDVPIRFRGADGAIGVDEGKTLTVTATDPDPAVTEWVKMSMGIWFQDRFNSSANNLEKIALYGGGAIVATAGAGSLQCNSWGNERHVRAGIGISNGTLGNGTDVGVSTLNRPVSVILDNIDVTVDGTDANKNETSGNWVNYPSYAYGIYSAGGTITMKNGATLIAKGGTAAVDAVAIEAPAGYKIIGKASTEYAPTALDYVDFDPDDLATYKYLELKVVAEDYVEEYDSLRMDYEGETSDGTTKGGCMKHRCEIPTTGRRR